MAKEGVKTRTGTITKNMNAIEQIVSSFSDSSTCSEWRKIEYAIKVFLTYFISKL